MIQENNPEVAFDKSKTFFFSNLMKRVTGEVLLTDEEIEARRKDYWKCPACKELNYMNVLSCWKCDASRPDTYEHPGREEVRKDLQKENQSRPLWLGLISFLCSGAVLGRGYFRASHRDTWPDFFTIVFAGFFALSGIILIIYWLVLKVKGKL